MDKVNYMQNVPVTLDAILGIDLEKSKYTFKKKTKLINQLPLEFDGFIQLVDAGQEYDLKFKTPTSSFKILEESSRSIRCKFEMSKQQVISP
jgi:hypothetical protein